jgi:hypothetical protein
MIASCRQEKDIVLGYSPFIKEKGLLNALIRFEGFFTALNYLGFARAGNPYMGVGRNLSYAKSDFFRVSGFKKHNHIKSGDDDLLINEIATPKNTRLCLSANSAVYTPGKNTWKGFWQQRRRHLTTGIHYKAKHKFLLAFQPLSFLVMAVSAAILIVFNTALYIVLGLVAIRILLQFFIFSHSTRVLGQRDLVIVMPALEIISVAMSGLAHLANLFAKQTEWKN